MAGYISKVTVYQATCDECLWMAEPEAYTLPSARAQLREHKQTKGHKETLKRLRASSSLSPQTE